MTLVLGSTRLTGRLPTELGNLFNISTLDFQKLNLGGTIPTEFATLKLLTYFDVMGTNLEGPIPNDFCQHHIKEAYLITCLECDCCTPSGYADCEGGA